jgi:hypothetical protein
VNPGVAAVLSFFIPGLGQIYRGDVGFGLLLLIATIVGYALFIVPGVIIHIAAIASAYRGPSQSTHRDIARQPDIERAPPTKGQLTAGKLALFFIGAVVLSLIVALAFDRHDRAPAATTHASIPAIFGCGDQTAAYRYDASDGRGHLTITTVSMVDANAAESVLVDCLRQVNAKWRPSVSIIGSVWRELENRSRVRVALPDKSDSIVLSPPLHALVWSSGKQEHL